MRRTVIERILIWAGAALLTFAGGAKLTGEIQKQRDLKQFQEALEAAGTLTPPGEAGSKVSATGVDTSLWSEERIKGWAESLQKDFGAPLAVLSIPKIGLQVPVLAGTDELTLNRAVGLIEGTSRPGEAGNSGIAGHRDGFFRGLKDIGVGDTIEIRSLSAHHSYVVESIRIVRPEDVFVLDPTPTPVLTLVTCYPFYFIGSAPQRYIVRAVKNEAPLPTGSARIPPEVRHSSIRKEAPSP